MQDLGTLKLIVAGLTAALIGFSKTGVPGTGIVVVPILAWVFGGRLSVGATLPMLIMADVFAVSFYRGTANWMQIKRLVPWVIPGLLIGTMTLVTLGHTKQKDLLNPIIGWIVIVMLGLSLLRGKWGDRLAPTSQLGTAVTGSIAGFTTMISNAAGPVMGIFLTAAKMPKDELMGTNAWYFFIFNITKLPLMAFVAWENPANPVMTRESLLLNFACFPLIAIGAYVGKALFTKIPQKMFSNSILVLAAVAAIKLIFL